LRRYIAATQNNNEGISGIAPNVRIMPIKVFGQNANADNNGFAAAIDFGWQNGAHVISNSWGYGSDNPNFVPAIVAAINRAVTQGRGNLGSVVVFSASNSANHSLGNNGQVRFPSNVQINGVLTVGASERDDEQSDYSPTSNAANPNNQIIDIVAPSHRAYPPAFGGIPGEGFEVWTIDIPGVNGYNQWNDPNFPITAPAFGEILPTAGVNNLSYTGRMGGTSASCPQVAAVAALVLSLNNNLTQQQVFDIITQSAEDVGGYAYNANGWCPELGNGRLNACAALSRIPNRFSITGAGIFCNSSPYSISGLPQGSTVIWASLNPTVATISSTGVASRVSDGSVIFTATINIPNRCGNTTVTSNTITVGTGNSINFTQKTITCVNSKPYFFGAVAPVPFASNYVWYSKDESNPNNPFILRQSENSNTADFPLGNNKGNRYYTIRVIVTNPCGNKQSIDADGYIFAPSCSGLRVSATPNPTNNTMSIKVVNQQGLISADPNEKIYKLQVVDKLGTTHKEYKFSGGLKQTNINIGNLHSDIYILRIFDGTEWTSIQIIKN